MTPREQNPDGGTGGSVAPSGLMEAFWAYETALMANDLDALDRLFAPGPATLRGDAAGLLVGHDEIGAFRAGRGGAPRRRIVETHVRELAPDRALVVAITAPATGGRGQQTQVWAREGGGWVVTAAHVSMPPPALDTRVWRVLGDPLVPGLGRGPLSGHRVAVKDLYAVAGQRVGAGNPTWLAHAALEHTNALAVHALLGAGADLAGITRTDEFAWSLAGTNAHYGTPPNPRAPYRISGGSTSGSASAVALGHADIGLGTDTGGSIRVPAAYQGLYGIRTTHDAVSRDGLLPLAASFDAVGWLTRDAALLRQVGDVLLPRKGTTPFAEALVVPALLDLAEPAVAAAIEEYVAAWPARDGVPATGSGPVDDASLTGWLQAFRTVQAWEAWQSHGWWLADRLDTLGADVRARFADAATVCDVTAELAQGEVRRARAAIREWVGDRVVLLPSASSVAPLPGPQLDAVRQATLQLTCLAGLGGLPAVSIPLETAEGLPAGLCLLAGPGRDRDLLDLAVLLAG